MGTIFKPYRITIHCSDTKNGQPCEIDTIRRWHVNRGFTDIGYHAVIQPDGTVQRGRGLNELGAHVLGENEGNIGICLVGHDKYTSRQFDSLRSFIDALRLNMSIEIWNIFCHYEFFSAKKQGKTCPNIRASDIVCWYIVKTNEPIGKYLL